MRARDINKISCIYVTKKPSEIPYLANYIAFPKGFIGTVSEFNKCDLPSVKRLLTLDEHDDLAAPYFADPWNKTRRPLEMILHTD